MSYHISNLGDFGLRVLPYADMDGFVPQAGDKREDFTYEREYAGLAPWDDWVQLAVEATAEAECAARAWREGHS